MEDISDQDKVRIVSDFILHAPPGEFNEVFNDVRELLKNDGLLKEGASGAFAQYNKDQLTPVRIEGSDHQALITEFNDMGTVRLHLYYIVTNDGVTATHPITHTQTSFSFPHTIRLDCVVSTRFCMNLFFYSSSSSFSLLFLFNRLSNVGGGRFYDPRTKQSFKYDHLRKEACEYVSHEPDSLAESWRSALDIETLAYTANHYRHGVSSVFGRSQNGQVTLSVCIEDHQFQPKNFWNGRWRSQWHVTFVPGSNGAAELKGVLKAQVTADTNVIIGPNQND